MYDDLGGSLEPQGREWPENRRPFKIAPLSHWCHGPSLHMYSILLIWVQEFFSFSEHVIENGCLKAHLVDHFSCLLHLFYKFLKITIRLSLSGVHPNPASCAGGRSEGLPEIYLCGKLGQERQG